MTDFLLRLATEATDAVGGGPQSTWIPLGANIWVWQPSIDSESGSADVVEALRRSGMEPVLHERTQIILLSHLAEVRWINQVVSGSKAMDQESRPVMWAHHA